MNLDEVEVTEVEARVEVNMGEVEVNLDEVKVNLDDVEVNLDQGRSELGPRSK